MAVAPSHKTDGSKTTQIKTYDHKYLQERKYDVLAGFDPHLASKAEQAIDSLFFTYVPEPTTPTS